MVGKKRPVGYPGNRPKPRRRLNPYVKKLNKDFTAEEKDELFAEVIKLNFIRYEVSNATACSIPC